MFHRCKKWVFLQLLKPHMNLKAFKESPYLQYGILILFVLLLVPPSFFNRPQEGLDPSWQIAVHLAIKQHLTFGRDFVFTYGPLGIISTRLPIGVDRWVYVLLDGYLFLTFFLVLREIARKHFGLLPFLYIFFLANLAMYEFANVWFFVFFLFYICRFVTESQKPTILLQAALLSLISLYCKISLGFIAIFIFIAALAYMGLARRVSLQYVLVAASVYINLFLVSAAILNVDIAAYFSASLHIINSYNDAMLRPLLPGYETYFYTAVVIIAGWVAFSLYFIFTYFSKKNFRTDFRELFLLGAVSLFVYVLFKNGFVRGETHTTYFFKGICFAIPLLYVFTSYRNLRLVIAIMSWVVIVISFTVAEAVPGSYGPVRRLYTFGFVSVKVTDIVDYVNGFKNYNGFRANPLHVDANNPYKKIIGEASVDIFPSEISMAYFNDLNYQPRPIIQSYSAYDRYLDSLNASRYNSSRAPEYILFSLSTIDDRVPYFDESRTKMAILANYELVKEVNDVLVLKRNPSNRRFETSGKSTLVAKLGEDVEIPEGHQLMFSEISTEYSAVGKVKRLFYKPPSLKITFTLDNGEQRTFTAIKPILAGGVLLNRFIDSEQEFNLLMNNHGASNSRVRKVRLDAADGESGFDENITFSHRFFDIINTTREGLRRDSAHYAALRMRFQTEPLALSPSEKDTAQAQAFIENFQTHSNFFIKVSGWAFLKHHPGDDTKIAVVLSSADGEHYALKTSTSPRPDVAGHFNRKDIMQSGFSATTSKAVLPSGDYKVGLLLQNANVKTLKYFDDKAFVIRKPAQLEATSHTFSANSGDLVFNVESVKDYEHQFVIQGWAFLKGASKAPDTKLFLANGRNSFLVSVDHVRRADVASYLKVDAATNAGFYSQILKEELPAGTYTIGMELRDATGKVHRALTDQKVTITKVAKPEVSKLAIAAGQFPASIDFVKKEGTEVIVSGWAVTRPEDVATNTVNLVLKNASRTYSLKTALNPRPDVTAHFKSAINIDDCGFSVRFLETDLDPGKYQVGIHVKSDAGKDQLVLTEQYLVVR
jgi:hypothetical protein